MAPPLVDLTLRHATNPWAVKHTFAAPFPLDIYSICLTSADIRSFFTVSHSFAIRCINMPGLNNKVSCGKMLKNCQKSGQTIFNWHWDPLTMCTTSNQYEFVANYREKCDHRVRVTLLHVYVVEHLRNMFNHANWGIGWHECIPVLVCTLLPLFLPFFSVSIWFSVFRTNILFSALSMKQITYIAGCPLRDITSQICKC